MISVSEAASLPFVRKQLSPKAKFAWDKFLVKSFISTLPQESWGKTTRRTLIVCQSQLCLPLRKIMINLDMININKLYDYCMINSAGSLDCRQSKYVKVKARMPVILSAGMSWFQAMASPRCEPTLREMWDMSALGYTETTAESICEHALTCLFKFI